MLMVFSTILSQEQAFAEFFSPSIGRFSAKKGHHAVDKVPHSPFTPNKCFGFNDI